MLALKKWLLRLVALLRALFSFALMATLPLTVLISQFMLYDSLCTGDWKQGYTCEGMAKLSLIVSNLLLAGMALAALYYALRCFRKWQIIALVLAGLLCAARLLAELW